LNITRYLKRARGRRHFCGIAANQPKTFLPTCSFALSFVMVRIQLKNTTTNPEIGARFETKRSGNGLFCVQLTWLSRRNELA
jgi:hypothetical protein